MTSARAPRVLIALLLGIVPCLAAKPSAKPAEFKAQWQKVLDAGDDAKARSLCEAAGATPATRVEALVCLANIEFKEARHDFLELDMATLGLAPGMSRSISPESLKKALKSSPDWNSTLVDKAIGYLDEAIGLEPTRGDLWLGKAHILRATGRRPELCRHLARAAKEWPGATPDDLAAYGREYVQSGDLEAGAEVLEALTAIYPAKFELWSDAGAVNAMLGRYERALELFAKSETLGVDDMLLVNIANANIRLGRIGDALPYLKRMYDRHPTEAADQLRFILGAAAVKGGEAKSLIGDMKPVIADVAKVWKSAMTHLDPDLALSLAQATYESKDNDLTLLALANANGAPRSLFLRAGVYEALGRHERTAADLEAFLAAATDADRTMIPQAESNLGLAYLRLARPKEALPHLTHAVALGIADSGDYEALGMAHEQSGNTAEAIAAFDAAIKADTDDDAVARCRLSAERLRKTSSTGSSAN